MAVHPASAAKRSSSPAPPDQEIRFCRAADGTRLAFAIHGASSDARGLLGLDGVAPDLADLAPDIKVSSPSPKDRVEAMLAAWRERCPIYLALLKPNSIALTTADAASVS